MDKLLKIFNNLKQRYKPIEKAPTIQKVAIFGFADAKKEDKVYEDAYKVAYLLAKAGYVVVDGGGPGVMQAASKGAKMGGGHVIGVTLHPKDEIANFEGRDQDNPIDEEIKTTSYIQRTLTLMQQGQVYVIFNGASGTISEFGMAWGLARIYFGHHKPLILYGKFWKSIMNSFKRNLMLRPEEGKVYKIVTKPEEVLQAIKQFEKEIEAGEHEHLKTSTRNEPEAATDYMN